LLLIRLIETRTGQTWHQILKIMRPLSVAIQQSPYGLVLQTNRVTSEQKRLIGYLASLSSGCRYCQAHTALAAKRYGASDERLHAIWEYRESPLFTDAERAAFDFAVAASSVPNAVDEAIADALHAHWTEEEIVEILGVISLFGFLNRWNDSMGTTLESGARTAAGEHLGDAGWDVGKHR
ncbi:MAG: carboxymuconolactone decarboxylase family protein, partial [Wenzhouxiangella sp.]